MKTIISPLKLSLIALCASALAGHAADVTWTGANNANWNDAGNWSPGLPATGDTLLFGASGQTAPNNDITDGIFGGINFAAAGSQYVLSGNTITLDTALVVNSNTSLQTISMPVVLTNAVTFNTVSNLDTTVGDIVVLGAVGGTGSLTKNGNGTLTLSSKSYSGSTTVNGGMLVVSNDNGGFTLSGGSLLMNFRTYFMAPTITMTADASAGIALLDNTEPRGLDMYGSVNGLGYKFTKIGEGIWRQAGGSINASSIDVAEGTLANLGGSSLAQTRWGTTNVITVQPGATLRADDGGVCPNPIVLNGGDGTVSGSYTHQGTLVSGSRNNGGNPTNNIFAGPITLAADSTMGSYYGKMIVSGNISGSGSLTKIGGNPLVLSGSNTYVGSTIISAGSLQIGSSNAIPAGNSILIYGASTLDLNGNNVLVGGTLYDDSSTNGTIDNTSANAATLQLNGGMGFVGPVKNTGGPLSVINSAGYATLFGANSYTGSNVVQSGTLDINIPTGTSSSGMVYLADNANLILHKTAPSSMLRAAGAVFGTAGSTSLTIDLAGYGNSSQPIINATNGAGVLAANGTLTVTFNNTANMVVGQFPIIKYISRTGSGSFVLNPLGGGIVAQIVTNAPNNSIDLKITSAPITTWKGNVNNLWDLTTTNWTYSGSPVLYSDGSALLLDDTALTNIVNLTTTLSPSSTIVSTTNTYTFVGNGSLAAGDLTKNGTGTLVLLTTNTYANTTISAGTLQVGSNGVSGSLGSGTVNNSGTLVFNRTDNITIANAISGGGALVKNNTNIVTLSSGNAYSGGTLVNQGVLKLGNNTALGVPAGPVLVTVSNGASLDLGGRQLSTGYVVISGPGISSTIGALQTTAGMGCTIGCTPNGPKYLRLAGDASIGDSSGDFQLGIDSNANGSGGVGSIDGQGFTLTKIGANTLVLEATNYTALSQFVIAAGGVEWANTAKNPVGTTCTVVVSNNAFINTWDNFQNTGVNIANNFIIGAGGGRFINNHGTYFSRPNWNTFSGAFTLNGDLKVTANVYQGGVAGQMNFTGPISGSGGVYNTSATNAPVTLSGANTYTGSTVVSNTALLQLSGIQQGGGSYFVYDGSTLDVSSQNGYPTVPMSSLMLGSANGGTLKLSRVTSLSTSVAPITATNLTVIGTNYVQLPTVAFSATAGVYPLIKYTTPPSGYGSIGIITIGGDVRGVPGYITNDTVNSQIALVIPGGTPVVWTGASGNSWDIANTASWATNGVATTYQQPGSLGDAVTFNDSSTVTNVNITVPVAPTAAIFSNTNNTYVLSGTNLTGGATLVKNGPGMLVLSNLNNNFSGGTLVANGTLKMATALSPLVALNNLSGTVTVSSGGTLDMGSNNPSAMIINANGAGVGGNGAIQANYSGNGAAFGPSIINLTGNTTIGGNNRWDLRNGSKQLNATTPNTTLTKVGSGYFALVAATVSTNIGDIYILGGSLNYQTSTAGLGNTNNTIYIGSSGQLGFYQASVPLMKSIVCSNGCSIRAEDFSATGQNVISGPVTLAGGTTTIKGNFFKSIYFSNTISGPGSLALEFQTYVFLAASNTFTGTITVPNCGASNGGRGTRLSLLGAGSITKASQIYLQGVASGQPYAGWLALEGRPDATLTLGANQLLRGDNDSYIRGNVVAPATSAIAPGGINNSNYQYMIIATNLTLQAGCTNYMDIYKTASLKTNDLIIVSNLVTYAGTLQIRTNGTAALIAGDTFKLFQSGSVAGNFTTIADDSGATWSFNPATGIATVVTPPPTVNLTPTNITTSVTGNTLTMQWPADHIGWFLQSNSISLINTGAWFNVPTSDTTNKIIITLDPTLTNVFYRMKY